MKIAILGGVIPPTTFIESLVLSLADGGHQVTLYGKKGNGIPTRHKGVKLIWFKRSISGAIGVIIRYSLLLGFKNFPLLIRTYRLLSQSGSSGYKQIMRLSQYLPVVYDDPEIFHIQWVNSTGEWLDLKELIHTKLITSLRGTQLNVQPVVDDRVADKFREVFHQVDGFHAVSKAMAERAIRLGADRHKVKVVYSGVNPAALQMEQENIALSIPTIVSVGRFVWIKGYDYALDAMHSLKEKGMKFSYTIVGQTPPDEIIYQLHQLGLGDTVKIMPEMSHPEVFKLLKESTLLLLPSVEEGIANVVLEAMAVGTLVCSSDCGGMSEVIKDGENGFLFKSRDVASMVDKIEHTLSLSLSERAKVINKARTDVANQFSRSRLYEGMLSLYEEVLEV